MLGTHFKTGIRNLQRNKGFALINILGLAVGISACLLIFLVIRFQTSFDKFHPNGSEIYRIGTEYHTQDGVDYSSGASFPAGPAIAAAFPQIKKEARIYRMSQQLTVDENHQLKKFNERNVFLVEPAFFQLFNFPWLSGDPQKVLSKPNAAALTEEMAQKYFGDWHNALGKTIKLNNKHLYTVEGILQNMPANTDFPLDVVLSFVSAKNYGFAENLEDWVSTFGQAYCFVQIPSTNSIPKFNEQLAAFTKQHRPAEYGQDRFVTQPLSTIHFDQRFGNYRGRTFSLWLIKVLVLIGIFLVVIACVNFINLATAQAVNRSKEVGVRKVLGGNRKQLALQFLSETFLITLVSVIVALGIASAVLPFLNKLLQVKMEIRLFSDPILLVFLLTLAVIVTLLSGLYPAVILSGFSPIAALKSKLANRMVGGISLRRILVVLQFGIAHVLIIGTLIVISQMNFFRKTTMGFTKAAILNVDLPGDSTSRTQFDVFKTRLLENKDISDVSISIAPPAANGDWNSDFRYDHATTKTNFSAVLKWADVDYFKTYNLQFLAGRPYYPGDTVREVVVNETLLRKLGVREPQDAIGKQIDFWDGEKVATITGVIRDFNSQSLRDPLSAVILGTWKATYNTLNIKGRPGKEAAVLAATQKIWNDLYPEYVYNYQFLDQTIENFYRQESQLSQLYKIFAIIAIFISCLGLYGLVSFMAAQRTKEMGIRKVLGATAGHIVYLLSREFSLLIIIAFIIAAPIAYFLMKQWLQDYTYRIPLGASVFLATIGGSMIIAWMTVGYRAIRAAKANPVKSLRTE